MKEIHLNLNVCVADKTMVTGYPNEFTQVILNILMNACEALLQCEVDNLEIVLRVFVSRERQ